VLAYGNSLTYGTGAAQGQSYPDVLAAALGRKVVNAGVPGEVSAQGLRRLPGVLTEVQPQLVILCHGGNDFLRRLPLAQTSANLRAMVDLCHEAGAEVVLIAVPQLGLTGSPPPFYAEIARGKQIPCEETILQKLLTDRELKSDPIHPNALGYRRLAEAVMQLYLHASGEG